MAVKKSGEALSRLQSLLKLGPTGSLSDGQLLERFTTGCGEPRELAFAALVERHGPFVLHVCRSVLRDEDATQDAFQATFLALARKAGSLWARDSLAPWLHQAAYRAAIHDRSAMYRRRAHEQAATALRSESVTPRAQARDDEIARIIHEEIDRLPSRFRVAVVLCDLEGRTHEQAARDLGCAVGTVKSRLARGRKRLRGQLVRRGVAPALALAALAADGVVRAAVPVDLVESTVAYAATARAAPTSVAAMTQGVLKSMFLRRVKLTLRGLAVMAALAAGAVVLAQSVTGNSKQGPGKARNVDSPNWTYHILVSRKGEPAHKVADVEITSDTPVRVDAPGALILIQPRRDGAPDGPAAEEKRAGNTRIGGTAGPNPNSPNRSGANSSQSRNEQEHPKILLTSPKVMDVTVTQQYACQIHVRRHINIRALVNGQISEVGVKEGQTVKQGDLVFKIEPSPDKPRPDAVFTEIVAPFDGIIGHLQEQQGSLVKEGDNLTTLSDNSVLWVYFNVPEKQYLDYMRNLKRNQEESRVQLVLANGETFSQSGKIAAVEAEFNSASGNIPFRADFPNPDGQLRHGQTGTVRIHRTLHDVTVVPMRATFESGDRRYVNVVDNDNVVHRREIAVQHEVDDFFVIKKGVSVDDRIVADGTLRLRDGQKLEDEFRRRDEATRKP